MPEPAHLRHVVELACHAYSVFKVLSGLSGQKEKGPGDWPGPLLTPWLVVGVPVAPTKEAQSLTSPWVQAKSREMVRLAISAQAGSLSRYRDGGFSGRQKDLGLHNVASISGRAAICQGVESTDVQIDDLPPRPVESRVRAKHRCHEPCGAGHRAGRGQANPGLGRRGLLRGRGPEGRHSPPTGCGSPTRAGTGLPTEPTPSFLSPVRLRF